MTKEVLIQKGVAFGAVAVALLTLSPFQMALCFAVLGQGHFIASYYYRWKSTGTSARTTLLFVTAVLAIFYAAGFASFEHIAFLAGLLFFLHHFQDEPLLWGKERSFMRTLEQIPPVLLYSALASDTLFDTALFFPALLGSALVALTYAIYAANIAHAPDTLSAYLFSVAGVVASLRLLLGPDMPPEHLFGSIILFHYTSWYVHYYFKSAARAASEEYVLDMLAVHGVVFFAYAMFLFVPKGHTLLQYVFLPLSFYLWAILHILFTVRPNDYVTAFART